MFGQAILVRGARIMNSAVRVVNQAKTRPTLFDRVIERTQTKLGVDLERDGPAYDSARVEIQNHGQDASQSVQDLVPG